jgi:enoyl-CoA hydratase
VAGCVVVGLHVGRFLSLVIGAQRSDVGPRAGRRCRAAVPFRTDPLRYPAGVSDCFELTVSDHVAHLRLNRPDELNTMVPEFWSELPRIVRDLDARAAARVLVISSTGRHFSAGMDLSVFTGGSGIGGDSGAREAGRQRAHLWMLVQHLQDSFTALEASRMPVLAAIQGGCIGGAVDMVTAADARYCTEDAFFCVQEINIGMTADVGTLQRLPKLIPEGIARELAYTGDRMPADRALACGLVNGVYPDHATMVDDVLAIAGRIARHSPLAIWGTKEMLNYTRDHSVADSLRYMAGWQSGMFQPADMIEEFSAKAEGREPAFEELPARPDDI